MMERQSWRKVELAVCLIGAAIIGVISPNIFIAFVGSALWFCFITLVFQ